MVNILPLILLTGVQVNTSGNAAYNYVANCDINYSFPYYIDVNGEVLNAYFWSEGDLYFNNEYSYTYVVDSAGIVLSYEGYDDELFDITNYFVFDVGFESLFSYYMDWRDLNECYINYKADLSTSTFIADSNILYNFANENGLTLDSRVDLNIQCDNENNSAFIDTFNQTINNALLRVTDDNNYIYREGYNNGYTKGRSEGEHIGYIEGYDIGSEQGYNNGFNDGFNADSTALTIFNGILSIGMIPVNFFLSIFNFEILGINLTSFITSMFTLMIVIVLLRTIFNGGSNG